MAADLGTAQSLASELNSEPRANANNAVKLLALLGSSRHEGALKAAMQGLKLFFVGLSHDGDFGSSKRQKLSSEVSTAPSGEADTDAVFRAWLRRQYDAYTGRLLDMVSSSTASASVQVSAAACVMECVRSEGGPGTFSVELYERLLRAALISAGTCAEVLALLMTKYIALADVRYYTLITMRNLLPRYAVRGAGAGAASASDGDDDDGPAAGAVNEQQQQQPVSGQGADRAAANGDQRHAQPGSSSGEVSSAGELPVADLCRNVMDLLMAMPESLATDVQELTSWCGMAEAGLVTAAPDKNESARNRRKRQQQQQQQHAGVSTSGRASDSSTAAEQRASWASFKNHRRVYGEAWLAFLRLPLPSDVLKKVLVQLPSRVIPHMNSPLLLSDFLTYTLARGGLLGILALNGLFILVTKHGLEYPAFYKQLYNLLVPEVFAARHRSQFLRLADIFLSSGLVPAYTVAAFIKRFARLALCAPPPGAMIAMAFMHNMIRRHPSLMVMLHNPKAAAKLQQEQQQLEFSTAHVAEPDQEQQQQQASAAAAGRDVYDEVEPDPASSRAVESSLWEITLLRNHYCPQVSTLAAVFDKDIGDRKKTAEVDIDPLLTASYASLMGAELSRRLKQVPTAFYAQAPQRLFDLNSETDMPGWDLGLPSA